MIDSGAVEVFLTPAHREASDRFGAFCSRELAGYQPDTDAEGRLQAREILARLGQGWIGTAIPRAFASAEMPQDARGLCLLRESLGYHAPLADAVFALQGLGSTPLALAGTDSQQERWLPAVARGEAMAAFAMTEPEAGSDVASMRTTARHEDGVWLLDGEKTFISNAGLADFYVVFAQIDPAQGSRGIGAFLVEKGAPGLEFLGPQVMSAPHPLGRMGFRQCRAELVCREGFKLGMRTLDALRVSVAAAACGMATRALHEASRHARKRQQFGKPLADFQLIQSKLAQMAIGLDASRLLTYRAAWLKDQGRERVTGEVAMAKAFATETAQTIIDQAMQVCGGSGMLAQHPVERLYRSIRSLRIYEGTTEIQHLILAREILKSNHDGSGENHVDAS